MRGHRHDIGIDDLNVDPFFLQILQPAQNVVQRLRLGRHPFFRHAGAEKSAVASVTPVADWPGQKFPFDHPAETAGIDDLRTAIAKFFFEIAIEQVSWLVTVPVSINDHVPTLLYFSPISFCASANNVRSAICARETFLSIFARANASSRAACSASLLMVPSWLK